jgi:hypothetical protein
MLHVRGENEITSSTFADDEDDDDRLYPALSSQTNATPGGVA